MQPGTRTSSNAIAAYETSSDPTAVDKRARHREPVFYFIHPFERPVEDVPGDVARRFAPLLRELEQLGFHSAIWHVIEDDLRTLGTYLATLQGDSGCVWARVHLRVSTGSTPPTKLYCELVSELRGGAFLWSLSSKPDLEAPPACTVLRDVGATPGKLLERHLAELRLLPGGRVVPVDSTDALRASAERHHAVVRDFHLGRGVFAPLTAAHRRELSAQLEIQALAHVGDDYLCKRPRSIPLLVHDERHPSNRALERALMRPSRRWNTP